MRHTIFVIIFLVTSLEVSSQQRHSSVSHRDDDRAVVLIHAYADSLSVFKDSLFQYGEAMKRRGRRKIDAMRLFLPVTYYKDITHDAFSLGGDRSLIGDKLMRVYLKRPDLVTNTERSVLSLQTTLDDIEKPLQHDAKLVEKASAKPIEPSTAPVEVLVLRPNFWTYKGDYSLQFLQNYISGNWYRGGESNYSTLAAVVMQADYNNKQKVKWENRLELKYGMQSSRSDSLHSFKSTEDLIRLTSKLGLQATKHWYYTFQFIGYTQFTHSFRSNDPKRYADFLAPLNLNMSIGMDYSADWLNHKLKGNFHMAPVAYNLKYTRLKELSGRLGIEEGKHFLHDFGSEFTVDLEWKLMDALTWKTRLYGYTTYERAELEWENTFTLQFNRYIATRLFLYPRFDDGVGRDGHHGYWQYKEFASVGFQYSF
ncbi:MAG: DUF3078 domain-containing protein [Prevotella sp.]|nr:DUF3078 domain-containing protein [Prevotella sp.]